MDWPQIVKKIKLIKEEFDKSYKCLNIDRNTKRETIVKHITVLCNKLEQIRIVLNVNYNRLSAQHKLTAENFFRDIRNRIITISAKKGIEINLPNTLHQEVKYLIPTHPEEELSTDIFLSSGETEKPNMAQTLVEFLNTTSKLIPDFDGKSENLRSFLDALALLDSIKGDHETTAVSLIKTKLKGNTRNLINNEKTIPEIIDKLKSSVKGESVEVLTAKIMNTKQFNKTANNYCSEIENLTKSLENAYISDGLSSELASKYSTNVAVKALAKNSTIDKVKLIMEAGQFNNMNDAISKFINSCTEATGQQNAVLHFRQNFNQRGYNNQFHRRYNYQQRTGNYSSNNNRPSQNQTNNFRNRPNQTNRRRNSRNYVRAMNINENTSENAEAPLR